MTNRRLVAVLVISSLWACLASAGKPSKLRRSSDPVTGQYIVVLDEESRKHVPEVAEALAEEHGVRVRSTWNRALIGFSAEMNEAQAEAMSRNPHVEFIEEDSNMYLSTTQTTDATRWNLDRIDQSGYPLSGTFSYGQPGISVRAYVMDTGVMATHDEFRLGLGAVGTGSSRVEAGVSFVGDGYAANAPCTAPADQSLNAGHGTAVASILGGRLMGVAKNVRIIPVRTLSCRGGGAVSASIDGLNWIMDHYDTHAYAGVVNISNYQAIAPAGVTCPQNWFAPITAADQTALEQAINSVVSYGLPVVVSANNQNADARCTTPARVPAAITVGGTMMSATSPTVDNRWLNIANPTWSRSNLDPGSNWGPAIDIFAPAHNIRGAHITSTTAERTVGQSGTSFAAPHVAGEVARYLQAKGKSTYNPTGALGYLLSIARSGIIVSTPAIPMNGSANTFMQSRYTP